MINNMNTASSVLTRKSRIGFAVIGLLSLTLFYRAFSTHLIGDDYWWIYNAAYIMNKLSGWIAAFAFENASGFYRPLTQNVFFFVAYNLFGLHSFYYHIVSFVFVIFSGFFVYKIILTICEDNSSAIVGTSIFLFSSLLYSLIAWASAFSQTGSGFLYVLTIYLYIQGRKYRTWSYIGFILCLMSGEITSTLPAFLVLYEIVKQQNGLLASIRKTIYFWIIYSLYLISRFSFIGFRTVGPFGATSNFAKLLKTLIIVCKSLIGITPSFLNSLHETYWNYPALLSLLIACSFLTYLLFNILTKSDLKDQRKILILGIAWAFIGCFPVILFSANDFARYTLEISLIGYSLVISALISSVKKSKIRFFAATLVCLSIYVMNFCAIYNPYGNNNVQGVKVLGYIASKYAYYLRKCKNIKKVNNVYIFGKNGGTNLEWLFGGQWEARVVLHNPSVTTYYVTHHLQKYDGKRGVLVRYRDRKNKLTLLSCYREPLAYSQMRQNRSRSE